MPRFFRRFTLILFLAAFVPAQAARQTSPQVDIATGDMEAVRGALIRTLQGRGFKLTSDSTSLMSFSKPVEGMRGPLSQLLLGNAYSTPPQLEAHFSLAKTGDHIQVAGNVEVSTEMPGGQVKRQDLTGNERMNQDLTGILSDVNLAVAALSPTAVNLPPRSIGIALKSHPQGAEIVGVASAGPAAHAGFLQGDILTHVNGIALTGMNAQEITKLISAAGDTVQLTSVRTGAVTVEKADSRTFAPEH